ncbi:HEPN domain-containing protein [Streptomyces albidoflavus]|uniref:HEPN domain-containing protein n=1 Tax=Streptomyces albidoflavus TaxID=1886 RepID=UPI0034503F38
MPRQRFTTQLADVYELLDVADALTVRHPSLTYFPHRITVNPLLSGAVVLLCARFEEFLKNVITYSLERYAQATPPLQLTDLPELLQVQIVHQSMHAALQKNRHGQSRAPRDRLRDGLTMARHFVSGNIRADHAIETGGNPGPETLKTLMKLVGVPDPWRMLRDECNIKYTHPTIVGMVNTQVGDPYDRLDKIIAMRNKVAHSGSHITSSSAEIRFDVDFVGQLSGWIYEVLKQHVENFTVGKGHSPAVWQSP